ncbi:MAG: adenylyltransferase/cytidyltransferase family protein [Candidatus Moraniibacteriota bacterium]
MSQDKVRYTEMAYIGRFNPQHLGHETMIRMMLEMSERSILFIGSATHPRSLRHFFDYPQRASFLKRVFPNLRVLPLPDFNNNAAWLTAINDMLSAIGFDPKETVFMGGCREEISVLVEEGHKPHHIVDRFSGRKTKKVSATEVRNALLMRQFPKLRRMINPVIYDEVVAAWETGLEEFKKQ